MAKTTSQPPPSVEEEKRLWWNLYFMCIMCNLSFVFLLNLLNYIQVFVYITILFTAVVWVLYHPNSPQENRLVLGVIIVDCWFNLHLAYLNTTTPALPLLLESLLGVFALVLGLYNWVVEVVLEEKQRPWFISETLVFLVEVVVCTLPVNIVHNLPAGTVAVYIVFVTAYWYLLEAFLLIQKKKMKESPAVRVGVVIPMFVLPFYAMCGYYLFLASITGFVYSREGEEERETPPPPLPPSPSPVKEITTQEEEVPPEIKEEEEIKPINTPAPPLLPPPQPLSKVMHVLPTMRLPRYKGSTSRSTTTMATTLPLVKKEVLTSSSSTTSPPPLSISVADKYKSFYS
jgi:hypothetical protein